MVHQVVVTGMGVVSSVGIGTEQFWEGLQRSPTQIGEQKIAMTDEILSWTENKKERRRMDPLTHYAGHAAMQAMEQANLPEFIRENTGVILGVGFVGVKTYFEQYDVLKEKGADKVSPFTVPEAIANRPVAAISMKHGLKGSSYAVVTACASGTDAIGQAMRAIRHGYLDAAIAGGAEAAIHPLDIAAFKNMTALSNSGISMPFSAGRDGFVMSEGAGVLVLERYDLAKKRGAPILAEIMGYGTNTNAEHMTAPSEKGTREEMAMTKAIEDAGLQIDDIHYINAHGTSTDQNDANEAMAIYRLFGDAVPVSSTKGATGHALGAAGGIEAIATILALHKSALPFTVGTKKRDPELSPIDVILHKPRHWIPRAALSNSFGFGGHNASVVIVPA